jgi:hypothetical protein
MAAQVDGNPWVSTRTFASAPLYGGHDALFVGGLGENFEIVLGLPTGTPHVGNYELAEGWSGSATCGVLTSQGWIVYSTNGGYRGYVTVTRVDSTSIEGGFEFYAYQPASRQVLHLTAGAFNVPIEGNAAATTRGLPDGH